MEFSHLLITRFNIKINTDLTKSLNSIDIATNEEYLNYRFHIFEEYTVPSVQNQTVNDFVWLVFFSSNTPEKFKKRISMIEKKLKNFRPVYIKDSDPFNDRLIKLINDTQSDWILTSRLDNDDAIHEKFVEQLHYIVRASEGGEYVILFPLGLQYDESKNILARYYFETNHFSSLIINKTQNSDHILNYDHMKIRQKYVVSICLENRPMWMEIIHKTNVSNRLHPKMKDLVSNFDILNQFHVKINSRKQYGLGKKLYVIFIIPINAIRLIGKYGFLGIIKKCVEKIFR